MEGVIVYLRLVFLAEGVHFVPLGQKGGFEGGVYIVSIRLLETFLLMKCFFFTSGFWRTSVKSLQL